MIPQPITTDLVPVNRHQKKLFYNELEKIAPRIKEVEDSFIEKLFGDNDVSYDELYKIHLLWYQRNVGYIMSHIKPKVFQINKSYFSQMFAPLEKYDASKSSFHLVRKRH